ncbi:MAG: hypothetical protein CM15mP55_2180 [Hyphomicrobiales bacterium]|nr:MAG: hypothetical protein CM15mP55_2180 [Hyphomicrobiales bacterium]
MPSASRKTRPVGKFNSSTCGLTLSPENFFWGNLNFAVKGPILPQWRGLSFRAYGQGDDVHIAGGGDENIPTGALPSWSPLLSMAAVHKWGFSVTIPGARPGLSPSLCRHPQNPQNHAFSRHITRGGFTPQQTFAPKISISIGTCHYIMGGIFKCLFFAIS